MDVHPPKNGINRYWSIPKSAALILSSGFICPKTTQRGPSAASCGRWRRCCQALRLRASWPWSTRTSTWTAVFRNGKTWQKWENYGKTDNKTLVFLEMVDVWRENLGNDVQWMGLFVVSGSKLLKFEIFWDIGARGIWFLLVLELGIDKRFIDIGIFAWIEKHIPAPEETLAMFNESREHADYDNIGFWPSIPLDLVIYVQPILGQVLVEISRPRT